MAHILRVKGADGVFYDIPALTGKDGVDGKDGIDGTTPHIGDNGNWWIGDTDTGISAYQSQKPWRLINEVTLTEDVSEVLFETDKDGNPFVCDEMYVLVLLNHEIANYDDIRMRFIRDGVDAGVSLGFSKELFTEWKRLTWTTMITRNENINNPDGICEYDVTSTTARYHTGLRPQYRAVVGYRTLPKLTMFRLFAGVGNNYFLTNTRVQVWGR